MPSITEWAQRIAAAAIPTDAIELGPWLGSVRSRPRSDVPADYLAGSIDYTLAEAFSAGGGGAGNFLYQPRTGSWLRRGGQSQKFDTFGSAVGMLPAKWGARARWMEEFSSESFSDGYPTMATLLTKETVVSGLDDGPFSTLWLRDQVSSANYTLGSDYAAGTTYPSPGVEQKYKVTPLWYESGDGGVTRGIEEFQRRFFVPGSRRFLKVANWTYFPSVKGTPSRWRGQFAATAASLVQATSDTVGASSWDIIGATFVYDCLATSDDATKYISRTRVGGTFNTTRLNLGTAIEASRSSWVLAFRARRTGVFAAGDTVTFTISRGDGTQFACVPIDVTAWSLNTWTDYTVTIDQAAGSVALGQVNQMFVTATMVGSGTGQRVDITYAAIFQPSSVSSSRLMPWGPLPPTHAGTIAKGGLVASEFMRPDGVAAAGGWTAVGAGTIAQAVDETVAADSDYMNSASSNSTAELTLNTPARVPVPGDTVTLRYRVRSIVGSGYNVLNVFLRVAGVDKVSIGNVFSSSFGFTDFSYTLTATEMAAITAADATWATLNLAFVTASETAVLDKSYVSYAALELIPAAALATGGWQGKHRFYYTVAYKFEDGSIWAPCMPRAPSDQLANGYNLFTVDSANPDAHYSYLRWSNIPRGPYGVIARYIGRSLKIDSTTDDNLELNPRDLRVVAIIPDNTTTTYDDYFADDLALESDPDQLFLHFNHQMPPRSRYVAGSDMRVAVGYGGLNPCAIELAPVGRAADYDLNLNDDDSTAYTQNASYMRVVITGTASTSYLELWTTDGTSSVANLQLAFDTYDTLQKLVDRVNATSFSADGLQWRAQLLPAVNPNANPLTALTPHSRPLTNTSVVNASNVITRSGGGLGKLAVGNYFTGANVPASAYVTEITSDVAIKISANCTGSAVETVTGSVGMGDTPTAATAASGYQRVIVNALPGFLYFNATYLNSVEPIEKDAVWITTANPLSKKTAANCFDGRFAKLKPPLRGGIVTGIVGVDNGFVVPFSEKVFSIYNQRDSGTGEDKDYRLRLIGQTGSCSWGSVTPGNRCAFYIKPEGVFAADLEREVQLSEAIWLHGENQRGDFAYEMPLAEAASAKDDDTAYLYARMMRQALWVNYRASGSHPNRQVCYDFSSDREMSGLAGVLRPDGTPYGWSLVMSSALAGDRSFTVMGLGRRSDGNHMYAWNEQNAGSTGDGRIDEFETGSTDNGTAVVADAQTPYLKGEGLTSLSMQEVIIEHNAAVGSTGFLDVHRSYSDAISSLTPGTSDTLPVIRDRKMLPQAARVRTAAYFLGYRQTGGAPRHLRKLVARVKQVSSYN